MFLHSINNLRALSIVLIVFAHTYWISGWEPQSSITELYKFIFFGGTFYFLFISGFLFNHLSVKKFTYFKFLQQKFKNIASPYTFLSILPIIAAVKLQTIYPDYFFTDGGQGLWLEYIKPVTLYFLTGRALTGYWYIPCIIILFCASPLFVSYSKLSLQKQIILLVIIFIISGFTHRAADNMNPFQAVIYFSPMFIFGMLCSIYNERVKTFFTPHISTLIIISITLAAYQLIGLDVHSNLEKDMFVYGGFNTKLLEKGIQVLAIYLLFDKYFTQNYKSLSLLASSSFAIFFLHPIVIFVVKRVVPDCWNGFLYWHLLSLFVIISCVVIAWTVKKILGNKSRYVIGW